MDQSIFNPILGHLFQYFKHFNKTIVFENNVNIEYSRKNKMCVPQWWTHCICLHIYALMKARMEEQKCQTNTKPINTAQSS